MSNALIILCACPDEDTAVELASGLVDKKLAACVNILPGIRSIYRWQGTVNDEQEVLMVIKTLAKRVYAIEDWLLEHHPYDVPEIVAIEADKVSDTYGAWIDSSVGKDH